MAGVDKYNGKQTVVLGGYLNRYHQGNLNYLGIQTKPTIKRDWALDCFSRRINTLVITHVFVPLEHHIRTKILSELYF